MLRDQRMFVSKSFQIAQCQKFLMDIFKNKIGCKEAPPWVSQFGKMDFFFFKTLNKNRFLAESFI